MSSEIQTKSTTAPVSLNPKDNHANQVTVPTVPSSTVSVPPARNSSRVNNVPLTPQTLADEIDRERLNRSYGAGLI